MFQFETISAKMLDYYVDRTDSFIIDLRSPQEYEKGHVRGAVNVPYEELEVCGRLPGDRMLVFYCARGGASLQAARKYSKLGYRVRSVIGGFQSYQGRNIVISP